MQAFAKLLDTLSTSSSTLAKRRLMADYFKATQDPERGWCWRHSQGRSPFRPRSPT